MRRQTYTALALATGAALATAPLAVAQTGSQTTPGQAGQQSGQSAGQGGQTEQPGQAGQAGQAAGMSGAQTPTHHARTYGLTTDEIIQFQVALTDAGCNAGKPTGVINRQTREAMACAKQKKNVSTNNANELFRALNLAIITPDSMSMGRIMSTSAGDVSGRSSGGGMSSGKPR